jgi:stage II sporulation protein D
MSQWSRRIALLAVAIGAALLVARVRAPGPGETPLQAPPIHRVPAPPVTVPPPPAPVERKTADPVPSQAAVEVIDLSTGRAVFTQRGDVLARPGWPASVAKVFTLRAALDAGLVDATTRIACTGRVRVGSRTLQCVHPPLGRPLSAVEAVAYSCNNFFTSLRLPLEAASAAWVRAGLRGPPPLLAEPRLALVGLDGQRVSPRRLLRGFSRLVAEALARRSPADEILLDGLRAAAREGTAGAFAAAGLDALAKTGTAPLAGGQYGGLVVALVPAAEPRLGVVALGAGISGRDAAEIAARAVARAEGRAQADSSYVERALANDPRALRLGRVEQGAGRVRNLGLEDYVAAVVAAEAAPSAPPAVREALAIAARSYAMALRGRHADEGFDLCDLTHCQAFREPGDADRAAARATEGEVLLLAGRVVPGYHSASCGGYTESPDNVWPDRRPGLRALIARPDPAGSDHGDSWRTDVHAADLLAVMRDLGRRGDEISEITIEAYTPSGRARVLRVAGVTPAAVDAEQFRIAVGRRLGWQTLKSSLYAVRPTAHGFRFDGQGRGHGVGLCVAGASVLARAGQSSREIVGAYFPSAQLGPLPSSLAAARSRPRVLLPESDAAEASRVDALVLGHAAAVERASGVGLPSSVVLRFHPSVASYGRATGQPWWTTASTSGTRIDLLPLEVLERRALLDRTVRHELAHAITGASLAGTPRWVREGVARFVSGDRPDSPGPGDRQCPSDEQFDAAASALQLADLYDRALTCVVSEVARAGGDWRRVASAWTPSRTAASR